MELVPLKYLEQPHEVEDWASVFKLPRQTGLKEAPWDESMCAEGKMMLYVGWLRHAEHIVQVIDRGGGVGQVNCPECHGTGKSWDGQLRCAMCKGSGVELVSVP
jgi:hypothetical protein